MEPKKNPDKDVHRYSKHFFLVGLVISISIVITAFEWRTEKKKIDCRHSIPIEPGLTLYPVPITIQDNVPAPVPLKKIKVVDLSKITEIKNNTEPESKPVEVEPPTIGFPFVPGEIDVPVEATVDTFIVVQKMPEPVGGYSNFYKTISKSIKYPTKAKQRGTEGRVFVEFVVDQNGNPINLKVTKGIGDNCDQEALRVLKLMKWEPGKQRGNPVLVKMTMAISFRLN